MSKRIAIGLCAAMLVSMMSVLFCQKGAVSVVAGNKANTTNADNVLKTVIIDAGHGGLTNTIKV